MSLTPEGKVKKLVRACLQAQGRTVWHHWPVPYGYGESTLDCIGALRIGEGRALAFAIETKAPGEEPTPRQDVKIKVMREVGIKVFVIDGVAGVNELEEWISAARSQG
jgi:hypothetical protein